MNNMKNKYNSTGTILFTWTLFSCLVILASCSRPSATILSKSDEARYKSLSLQIESSENNYSAPRSVGDRESVADLNAQETPEENLPTQRTPKVTTIKSASSGENVPLTSSQIKKQQRIEKFLKKRPEIIQKVQASILDNDNARLGLILMLVGIGVSIVLGLIAWGLSWIGGLVFLVGLVFFIIGLIEIYG